jgi:hypothetical protein
MPVANYLDRLPELGRSLGLCLVARNGREPLLAPTASSTPSEASGI